MIRPYAPFLSPVTTPLPASNVDLHILVTGGAGFIGAHVVGRLLEAGARVTVIDDLSTGSLERLPEHGRLRTVIGDMTEPAAWNQAWQAQWSITRVLHLAGHVGVRRVLGNPRACSDGHRAMAQTLIETLSGMSEADRPGLIAASSSEVYRASQEPLAEDSPVWKPTDRGWDTGRWTYAASKLRAEQGFVEAGLNVLNLRLFNVVGPGQNGESGMVLPRFVEAARLGDALRVFGSGGQVRTFGHVECVAEDLAELCLRAAMPNGVLNLGGTAITRIDRLAQMVLAEAGLGNELLQCVDPAQELGADFEEVVHRVPALDRARSLGLVRAPWSLQDIVRDVWSRHGVPSPS